MLYGLAAITDMQTGQVTDQIVLDQQAADAQAAATAQAAQLAAQQAPMRTALTVGLLGGAAWVWWKYGKQIQQALKGANVG
jgi:hypothetical protein